MTQLSSGLVAKLQQALYKQNFYPGVLTSVFDANTVNQLALYWQAKGFPAPTNAAEATALLQRSFIESGIQDPAFNLAELTVLGQAYAEAKGLGFMGWLGRNWPWVVVGGIVVVGGAIGGYMWWQKSQNPMGELGDFGDLGCPCALGHGGRTANYQFPSGKKSGHYRSSTGRFHAHG